MSTDPTDVRAVVAHLLSDDAAIEILLNNVVVEAGNEPPGATAGHHVALTVSSRNARVDDGAAIDAVWSNGPATDIDRIYRRIRDQRGYAYRTVTDVTHLTVWFPTDRDDEP